MPLQLRVPSCSVLLTRTTHFKLLRTRGEVRLQRFTSLLCTAVHCVAVPKHKYCLSCTSPSAIIPRRFQTIPLQSLCYCFFATNVYNSIISYSVHFRQIFTSKIIHCHCKRSIFTSSVIAHDSHL